MNYDIRKMQSRDQDALEALFPEMEEGYFEDLYLEHLQQTRLVLVASHKPEEGERQYFGFVQLFWESTYTQFWRRNVSEITSLNVAEGSRRQGIGTALIHACEDFAREAGHPKIGIGVEDTLHDAFLVMLYESLGYVIEGHEDGVIWLWKDL